MSQEPPVLFFDGVCNLCNRSVDFLMRRDKQGALRFGSLQGEFARKTLPPELRTGELSSIVLADADGIHRRSTAILRALRRMGAFWGAVGAALLLVPRPLRDFVYDVIAKRRYRIFGQRDACRVPTEAERARFVD